MSVEIPLDDIVKIILQFCKENGLHNTFNTMQEETQVYLNSVPDPEFLFSCIRTGLWDQVLSIIATLHLQESFLINLYEHITLELIELRQLDAARSLINTSPIFHVMKSRHPPKFQQLQDWIAIAALQPVPPEDLYTNTISLSTKVASTDENNCTTIHENKTPVSKQAARNALVVHLKSQINTVQDSRLLTIIGQALKFQHTEGLLPPGSTFQLLQGRIKKHTTHADAASTILAHCIKFGHKSYPNAIAFSPDGQYLLSGSSDGFLEVWDFTSGKLRLDLPYQENEDLMLHDAAITAIAFSREGELFAAASADRKVKIWRIASGKLLRSFDLPYLPTCLAFSKDATTVLCGSSQGHILLLGLKSAKIIKQFTAHSSAVNHLHLLPWHYNYQNFVSASSDGSIRIWNLKSADSRLVSLPLHLKQLTPNLSFNTVLPIKNEVDVVLTCGNAWPLNFLGLAGSSSFIKNFQQVADLKLNLVDATLSPRAEFIYALSENGSIHVVNSPDESIVAEFKAHDNTPIAIAHHPFMNLIASCAKDGLLKIWKH